MGLGAPAVRGLRARRRRSPGTRLLRGALGADARVEHRRRLETPVVSALRSALTLAVVLVAAHLFGRIRGAVVDCSRAPVAEVSPALRERLARLDSDLLLSYPASSEGSMPPELRGVAEQVVRLLRSIEAAAGGAGGRVRVQILDPGADASLPTYLAGIGLAPFGSRSLALDAEVETSVWSSLRIAYGAHGSASVRAVTPEVLAGLQPLILAHLDLLEKPRRARVALSAPEEYRSLRKALRARAELLECDFDATAKIPEDADLFLWIDPTEAGPRQVAALRAALGRGSSVVVAGSELRAAFVGANPKPGSSPAVRFERTRSPPALYRELGLAPVEGIAVDVASKGSPALLRSTGADQDFRGLGAQPNGTLLFAAPTAIEPDAARLAELGLELTTLASSATTTRARPWREAAVPEADLRDTSAAVRAPRRPPPRSDCSSPSMSCRARSPPIGRATDGTISAPRRARSSLGAFRGKRPFGSTSSCRRKRNGRTNCVRAFACSVMCCEDSPLPRRGSRSAASPPRTWPLWRATACCLSNRPALRDDSSPPSSAGRTTEWRLSPSRSPRRSTTPSSALPRRSSACPERRSLASPSSRARPGSRPPR